MRRIGLALVGVCILGSAGRLAADAPLGLKVPPGFEVTEFADNRLAPNIYCLTIDPHGRVVVSGPGYVRILVDGGSGKADRALDFADGPKDGAQGLYWEGDWLYVTGDGGLRRYPVAADGNHAAGPSELIRALKTGSEHAAHAIHRGPDGWLYVLCGNNTGISEVEKVIPPPPRKYAQLPSSPIQFPVAGCVLRFTPDLKTSEVVADGFRNPYGMDFNPAGELFTFDSDNERCVSLPWYEGIRFYQVIPGGHYGWRAPQLAETWRSPPYNFDVVAPITTLGRGSPTGVVCYRHAQLPERYQGGFFLLDWTFGRVYYLSLKRSGATYTYEKELFLESVGDNGFAPTAAAVHPLTGDLYISIGGRGTRGAVYRIRYPARAGSVDPMAVARLRVKPYSLEWRPGSQEELLREATRGEAHERLWALLAIRRHGQHFSQEQLLSALRANWDHPDRYVRRAATACVGFMDLQLRRKLAEHAPKPLQQITLLWATFEDEWRYNRYWDRVIRVLARRDLTSEEMLAVIRIAQRLQGEDVYPKLKGTVWEGYSAYDDLFQVPIIGDVFDGTRYSQLRAVVRKAFPSGHADVDRELSRTLAIMEDDDPGTLAKVADRLTASSDPVEDIHYLIVLARLKAPRPAALTRHVAEALLALDRKLTQRHQNRDRNWPLRIGELYAELARKETHLHAAVLAHPDFGRPDHALFARAPGFDRRRAAERFLARSRQDEAFTWTPALVDLLGSLPEEQALPVLRQLWGKAGLEEAILPVLCRHPQPDDREKFLDGLGSPQPATIRHCLDALAKLPRQHDAALVLALVRCLRGLPDGPEQAALRARVAGFLRQVSGQERLGEDRQAWSDWLARAHPDLAARLGNADGVDLASWDRRLGRLNWAAGDPERGKAVFVKATCASCHSGAQALGPDLRGVAGRFSRADLLTAILQPSKDISPRYRTTLVATDNGKVYQGLVVYEAVDSLILQTGPAETVRIPVDQIATRRFTATSMMPAGLLDKLSDQEIADLYAYLKNGLGKPPRDK